MPETLIVNVIGYTAATLGTFLMVPQVLRTMRTKHVADVSSVMLIVYTVQCGLWALYGWFILSLPVLLCNCIAVCIGFYQLVLFWKYRRKSVSTRE